MHMQCYGIYLKVKQLKLTICSVKPGHLHFSVCPFSTFSVVKITLSIYVLDMPNIGLIPPSISNTM